MSRIKITESRIADEEPIVMQKRVFELMQVPAYYSLLEQLAYKEPTYWEKLKVIITAPDFIVKTLFAIVNIFLALRERK
jgi:hypothetical protein